MLLFPFPYSCSSGTSENDLAVFKTLNESLINANKGISRSNEEILVTLQGKFVDPVTHYKAGIWRPKAILIKTVSDTAINYIKGLNQN